MRERMRRNEERTPTPRHAWGALHLLSTSAAGFRIDDEVEPLSKRFDRDEVYKSLGSRMRVLNTGVVGRRRLVQRLLRILLRGQDARPAGTREVAGACVFGMKRVGKSWAVGRAIERAKQHAPELGVVVVHGAIDERSALERVAGGRHDRRERRARNGETCRSIRATAALDHAHRAARREARPAG
jgi:hypothetical protein